MTETPRWLVLALGILFTLPSPAAVERDEVVFRSEFEHWQRHVADVLGEPLRAPDPTAFDVGSALTLEGWFFLERARPRAWLMGKGVPIDGGASGVELVYELGLDDTGTRLRFRSAQFGLQASEALPLRRWTHLAAVLEGSSLRLYVDGRQVAAGDNAGPLPPAATIPFGIGAPFGANGQPAAYAEPGVHAQRLRAWSVARGEASLRAGMHDGAAPAVTAGLLGAWPLDDARGLGARDAGPASRTLQREVAVGVSHLDVLQRAPYFEERRTAFPPGLLIDNSGVALIDFDHDGDRDAIVFQVEQPPTFPATLRRQLAFRNTAGVFADATDEVLGTFEIVNPRAWHVADFTGDGRQDLFIAATGTDTLPVPGEQSRLLVQSSDGRLVDESATRLPQRDSFSHGLGVGDLEGDGDLDLLIANYVTDTPRLYLNDGAGFFSDVSSRLPARITSGADQHPSAALCDVNGDGRADAVFGGNYFAPNGASSNDPNTLLLQDAMGNFVDAPGFALPPKLYDPEGVTPEIECADLDGDGAPELLLATDIAGSTPGLQLLRNDGAGHFSDATPQLGLDPPSIDAWYVDVHVADMNLDGLPDIVLRTASRSFRPDNYSRSLLLNRGDATFVDASEVFVANSMSGLALGDLDGDAAPDLFVLDSGDSVRTFVTRRELRAECLAE